MSGNNISWMNCAMEICDGLMKWTICSQDRWKNVPTQFRFSITPCIDDDSMIDVLVGSIGAPHRESIVDSTELQARFARRGLQCTRLCTFDEMQPLAQAMSADAGMGAAQMSMVERQISSLYRVAIFRKCDTPSRDIGESAVASPFLLVLLPLWLGIQCWATCCSLTAACHFCRSQSWLSSPCALSLAGVPFKQWG